VVLLTAVLDWRLRLAGASTMREKRKALGR
jgi:hypothetical protein